KFQKISRLPTLEQQQQAWKVLNPQIARRGQQAIDECNAVLAVLDGPDVDSGTAAEIGYAFARGKPILGYRGDFRLSSDNSGAMINLQVEFFIRKSGGQIVAHTLQPYQRDYRECSTESKQGPQGTGSIDEQSR